MKPLSERDENLLILLRNLKIRVKVGMKPLSERDENSSEKKRPNLPSETV